jgi:hypothetical protein
MSFQQYDDIWHGLTIGSEFLIQNLAPRRWVSDALGFEELRLANSGLGWKASDEGNDKVITIAEAEVRSASWTRVARGFQLKIGTGKGTTVLFEGFDREVGASNSVLFVKVCLHGSVKYRWSVSQDYERLNNLFQQYYSKQVETEEISLRGWNWGRADTQCAPCHLYLFHLKLLTFSSASRKQPKT